MVYIQCVRDCSKLSNTLTNIIILTTLWGRYCSADEKTAMLVSLLKDTQQVAAELGLKPMILISVCVCVILNHIWQGII